MTSPSTSNAKKVFYERVIANLPVGYTSSLVKIPNAPFVTPKNSKWMRVSFIDQDVNNVQAGGLWQRYNALAVIDIFYPRHKDTITQVLEAETLALNFENQSFGGIDNNDLKCFEALIQEIGEEEAFYHVQINITVTYEGKK